MKALCAAPIRKGGGLIVGPAVAPVTSGSGLCPSLNGDELPPGKSNRRSSRSPASTSDQWCTLAMDQTTEAEPPGRGIASAAPLRYRTFARRRLKSLATRSMTGAGSTPVTVAPSRDA